MEEFTIDDLEHIKNECLRMSSDIQNALYATIPPKPRKKKPKIDLKKEETFLYIDNTIFLLKQALNAINGIFDEILTPEQKKNLEIMANKASLETSLKWLNAIYSHIYRKYHDESGLWKYRNIEETHDEEFSSLLL